MLDDFSDSLWISCCSKRTITPPENIIRYVQNKSYIGSFLLFWFFGIYAIPKIVEKLRMTKVVQGDRLDSVNPVAVSEGQLLKIALLPNWTHQSRQ
jgi:hypothetical protein